MPHRNRLRRLPRKKRRVHPSRRQLPNRITRKKKRLPREKSRHLPYRLIARSPLIRAIMLISRREKCPPSRTRRIRVEKTARLL